MPSGAPGPCSSVPSDTPSDTVLTGGGRNLDRLVERFWTGPSAAQSVVVTTGQLPATHVMAEEYVVLPNLARARFLVPVGAAPAVRSAFTSHLSTVSPRSRLYGRLIAAGFRTGAAPQV